MPIERILWLAIGTAAAVATTRALVGAELIWTRLPLVHWILLAVLGAAGAVLLGGGLMKAARVRRILTTGRPAQGRSAGQRVESVTMHSRTGFTHGEFDAGQYWVTHTRNFPIVEFSTEKGEVVRVEGPTDVKPSDRTGEAVAVVYDPARPSDAVIADFRQTWLGPLVASTAGGLMLFCGLAGFAAIQSRLSRAARAARGPEAVEAQRERDRQAGGRYTLAIKGTVVRAERLDSNGPAQYLFICRGRLPGKSSDQEFRTDFFPFPLPNDFAGRPVTILLDPEEPEQYYVPSADLMKDAAARRE